MIDDDFIKDLMGRADPAPMIGSDAVEVSHVLARIVETPRSPRWRAQIDLRPRLGFAYIAIALLIISTLTTSALTMFWPPARAVAATPVPLQVTPISESSRSLLLNMSKKLSSETPNSPAAVLRFQTWSLSIMPEESGLPTTVVPERVQITQRPDGSRAISVSAGDPYTPPGSVAAKDLVAPGTVLWEQAFAPGEYQFLFSEPPNEAGRVADYLSAHNALPPDPSAGDYLNSLPVLMTERTLTAKQESVLLAFLAELPDIETTGKVVDRLGRPGIAFSTTSRDPGNYVDTIIVSPTTGHILSYETTYTGGTRTDIAAPAVVAYTAWERTEPE
ncbi:hypothetical protein [Agromyces sp. NPDC058126]|uniref:hypothetical protein n=1 Tax=Agromyces sp. NPDC058126 TaxID=3346350 RepID=UPI0036DF2404